LSALLIINDGYLSNEKLTFLLSQLQAEVQNFILKLASEFTHRKEQLILIINNYDLILNIIQERIINNKMDNELIPKEILNNFQELISARINEYVEEVLSPYFGLLIKCVKECELFIDKSNLDSLKQYETKMPQLIRNFTNDWKKSLELINQEIMRTFSNFKNGQSILQLTLTQLVQYYHRFQRILSHNQFKNIQAKSELLNIHHLMVEIKKHKPTF
jgi:vacuolar protein sorting-associated protein 52